MELRVKNDYLFCWAHFSHVTLAKALDTTNRQLEIKSVDITIPVQEHGLLFEIRFIQVHQRDWGS
jgi:hypothetical protein